VYRKPSKNRRSKESSSALPIRIRPIRADLVGLTSGWVHTHTHGLARLITVYALTGSSCCTSARSHGGPGARHPERAVRQCLHPTMCPIMRYPPEPLARYSPPTYDSHTRSGVLPVNHGRLLTNLGGEVPIMGSAKKTAKNSTQRVRANSR